MQNFNEPVPTVKTFGEFLNTKRREREFTSLWVCERIGISPSYYCDIERDRRNPPDMRILERMVVVLQLTEDDINTFFDLAGKSRQEAPPDLPEYINRYQIVRVALRMAKSRGHEDDWRKFVYHLEQKPMEGG